MQKTTQKRNCPRPTFPAFLNTEQAILSKIENGQGHANREQGIKLAEFFM